eukprot:g61453.t1
MALEAALAAFRVGQHDVLTKFVANYEGKSLELSGQNLGAVGASAVAKGLQVMPPKKKKEEEVPATPPKKEDEAVNETEKKMKKLNVGSPGTSGSGKYTPKEYDLFFEVDEKGNL